MPVTARDCSDGVQSKRRDRRFDHAIMLLAKTRHNRAFQRAEGDGFRSALPLDARTAIARLAVPSDIGGSAIVLL